MNCSSCERLISAYIDDELDAARRGEVETHLDGCEACRSEFEGHMVAWEAAGDLRSRSAPDGLWSAIESEVGTEAAGPSTDELALIVRGLSGELRDLRQTVETLRRDLQSGPETVAEVPPRQPLRPRLSVWEEAVSRRTRSGVG